MADNTNTGAGLITVDPERHDDDDPKLGGYGAERGAVGTPGPDQTGTGEASEHAPKGILGLVRAFLGQTMEPKPKPGFVLTEDELTYRMRTTAAFEALSLAVDRLITKAAGERVTVAPSDDVTNGQTYVGTTAGLLINRMEDRLRVTLTNRDGTNSIFLGREGVTTGSGYELKAGETITVGTRAALYAIGSAAGIRIDYLVEIGSW